MKKQIVPVPLDTPMKHKSRAVRFGDPVFVSGTTGRDPVSQELPADIQGQTKQMLENIKRALDAAGASMEDVLKMTVYLADWGEKKEFDEIYISYFPVDPPARVAVPVAMGAGVKVKIETIASIPS